MVYDREGKKLWIVDETGAHRPIEIWDEVAKRPRRADLPDWWVVAKDISWRPPAGTPLGLPDGWTGKSLLSMSPDEVDRMSARAESSGGEGYKLGCGGKQQERYDTATGKYTGEGSPGGGQPKTKNGPAKTGTPAVGFHKAAGADKSTPMRTEYYKKAGADSSPWPESDPPTPPGVDLEKNMREAEAMADRPLKERLEWFVSQVDSDHPWDYKNNAQTKGSARIEDFGNYNYGATGAALGLPDWMLYRAAGAKQVLDHIKDGKYTNPLVFPYGDDLRDADMIGRGIKRYHFWRGGLKGLTR